MNIYTQYYVHIIPVTIYLDPRKICSLQITIFVCVVYFPTRLPCNKCLPLVQLLEVELMESETFWARKASLGEPNGISAVHVTVWYVCMVGVSSVQSFN